MPIESQKPVVEVVLQQLRELNNIECPADSVSLQEELEILQARHSEIKKTYKKAALCFHPDKPNGSKKAFQSLGVCFEKIDNDFTDQIILIEEQIKTGADRNVDIISRRRQAFYLERLGQAEPATNGGDFYTGDGAAARDRARVRSEEYAPFKKKKAATVEGQQPYQASDDKLDDQGKLRVYITVPVLTDHARGLLFGREKTFNLKKVNPNNQLFKESGCLHVASLPDDNAGLVEALKYAMRVSKRSVFLVNDELPANLLDLANNFLMMDHTYGAMSGRADCFKAPAVGVVIVPVDILPSMLAIRSMINSRLSGMASPLEDHVVIKPNYTSRGMIESLFDLVTVDTGAVQVKVVKFDAFHAFASVDEARNHRFRYVIHDLLNDSVCGDNYDKATAACRDTTNDLLDQLRLLFIPLLNEGPVSRQSGSSASRMLARFTPKKKLTEKQKAFCQAVFSAQSLDDIVRHLERSKIGITHSLPHDAEDQRVLALENAVEDQGYASLAGSPASPMSAARAAATNADAGAAELLRQQVLHQLTDKHGAPFLMVIKSAVLTVADDVALLNLLKKTYKDIKGNFTPAQKRFQATVASVNSLQDVLTFLQSDVEPAPEPVLAAGPAVVSGQPSSSPVERPRSSSPTERVAPAVAAAALAPASPVSSSLSRTAAKAKPGLSKGWSRAIRIAAGVAGLVILGVTVLTVIAVTKGAALLPLKAAAPWLINGLIAPLANLVTGSVPAAVGVSVAAGASIAASAALTVEPSPKRWFRRRLSKAKSPAATSAQFDKLGELEDDAALNDTQNGEDANGLHNDSISGLLDTPGVRVTGRLAFRNTPLGNPQFGTVFDEQVRSRTSSNASVVSEEDGAPLTMSPIPASGNGN